MYQSRSNLKMRAVNERTTNLVVIGTSALRQEWLEPNWNSEKSRAESLGSKFIDLQKTRLLIAITPNLTFAKAINDLHNSAERSSPLLTTSLCQISPNESSIHCSLSYHAALHSQASVSSRHPARERWP
jgi:hypothetical protein